jgi:hypothetical protein
VPLDHPVAENVFDGTFARSAGLPTEAARARVLISNFYLRTLMLGLAGASHL